ncbi:unnamed protein product [Paramecium pentaurelia]|uniref:Uncharacterized protein n=1 Tax=Paramecium pentaurelia TaxID=43138 RepID=A0A8S1T2Q0_9CILI|nr:unnamed protein product [Paramecium pentaurelia]
MNSCIKSIGSAKVLSIMLIADSLLIHIQSYLISNYNYLIIALSLTCFHGIVLTSEHFLQGRNKLLNVFFNASKGVAQIIVHYLLEQNWLIFAGIQIICIMKQDVLHIKYVSSIFFITQIFCVAFNKTDFIIVGVIRTVFNYILISQIFRFESKNTLIQLENILKHIQYDEFCLLDSYFNPIFNQQIFDKLKEEQVVGVQDFYIQTRIITPRDNTTNLIREIPLNCEEEAKQTLSIQDIIFHLKKNKVPLTQKLCYQLNNQQNYHIQIENIILDENNSMIMIQKRKKCENIQQGNQINLMIKTVRKVSHDMRNPLNAIINMQMCLKEQIDKELVMKYLKPSLNSCHLLLNLLNDILDSAQVENKKIKLVYRRFNLQKLIQKTISIFDSLKDKKDIIITFNYDSKIPIEVNSDKFRIRQIIMNLLSNAIKYTKPNGKVYIDCSESSQRKNFIKICIQDTGFGIKQENLKYLFKEYSKIEEGENQNLNPFGIGLGLMISNELAKLLSNNGIQVQSEVGIGSIFYFEIENKQLAPEDISESQLLIIHQNGLPSFDVHFIPGPNSNKSPVISLALPQVESSKKIILKRSQKTINIMTNSINNQTRLNVKSDEKSIARKQSLQAKQIQALRDKWYDYTNQKPPILIVDDDEVNIMVLQYLMEQMNISSDSAMNGMACLQKFVERQKEGLSYQLVFLDINMPEMNGFELAKKLIQIDPLINLIACSGDAPNSSYVEECKQSGIIGSILKPILKSKLKELLLKLSEGIKYDSQQFSYYC